LVTRQNNCDADKDVQGIHVYGQGMINGIVQRATVLGMQFRRLYDPLGVVQKKSAEQDQSAVQGHAGQPRPNRSGGR